MEPERLQHLHGLQYYHARREVWVSSFSSISSICARNTASVVIHFCFMRRMPATWILRLGYFAMNDSTSFQ